MSSESVIKFGAILLIVVGSFYMWYNTQGDDVKKDVNKATVLLPFNLSSTLNASGFGVYDYCPFINPYMSQLFSAGSLEVSNQNKEPSIFGALSSATSVGCGNTIKLLYNYTSDKYDVYCDGKFKETVATKDVSEGLNTYVEDTGFALNQTIPRWQCFGFFGILPFLAMFFFLKDILGFAMLSPKLKSLIVFFVSVVAIMTGTFAKFVWQLAYIASLSVQSTFILIIFLMSFVSVILSWITSINNAMAEAKQESTELVAGLAQKYTFEALSDSLKDKK